MLVLLPVSHPADASRPAGAALAIARAALALVLIIAAGALPAIAAPAAQPRVDADRLAQAQARRFDQVENLVRRRYYAPDLHDVDWPALCARYRPAAIAAAGEAEWYALVNAMLSELRDAHTRVVRPLRDHAHETGAAREAVGGAVAREAMVLESGHVLLRFHRFDAGSVRWLRAQLMRHAGAPGVILDLRRNRGGSIDAAQRAVGLFFEDPVPMGWVVSRTGRRWLERSRDGRFYATMPATVLIGPGSHSSAEVFAYALRHHRRAVLIGGRTAGEVLGARRHRLADGGGLYISETDFHRLDGGRLEGAGVTPDFSPAAIASAAPGHTDPDVAVALDLMHAHRSSQVVGNQVVPPRGLEPRTN